MTAVGLFTRLALQHSRPMVESEGMTTLAQHLIAEGIPPTLLIDLLDIEGMRRALASELTVSDVDRAIMPALEKWIRRSA
jgi:hypothetical protein